jgi:hypothetical protein
MSTLKVDTYLTRGGASEIAIDKLKGVTAAGSMLVVAEGGTVTTNLQQGLSKSWINFDGTGTIASRDTFNVSSLADNGTGLYTVTFASNMSNADYATGGGSGENTQDGGNRMLGLRLRSTSVRELRSFSVASGATDNAEVTCIIAGDLA